MCIRDRGIGEKNSFVASPDSLWIVLLNNGDRVPTSTVFQGLAQNEFSGLVNVPRLNEKNILIKFLKSTRNDLEKSAIKNYPAINDLINSLNLTSGCLVARMSGSGSTCFGLYEKKHEAEKAKKEINSENFSYQIVDVTDFKIVKKSVDELEQKLGQIDIFVNNAGMTGMNAKVWDYPLDEWQKVIELNLNSTFYCCKAIVPHMIKNNYGRIVNIASIAGKEGNPNASAYSTSKAGVIGLTKSLGKELALKNIAVNCVTPAAAKTRIFDQMTEEHINYMLSKIPRNKFAKVNELASLVTWLSSEENSFSTAAVFDLSGGRATY